MLTGLRKKNEIRFAFYIGEDQWDQGTATLGTRDWVGNAAAPPNNSIFFRKLVGVVFQIEEVSMTNDLLETTVNYLALADDTERYEAISPATSCDYPNWQV